jgi:hypothetical protein
LKLFKNLFVVCCLLLGTTTEVIAQKGSRPSFSGGSSSTRSSFSGSSSSSSRPSFSGGSSSSSSKPSSSSSSGSSSSKPLFSGGSSSSSSGSSGGSSRPSFTTSTPTKTTSTTPIPNREPTSVSKKPLAPSFDTVAQAESKKASSRTAYERSETPASTYKTPAGKEVKIDPKDKESVNIRSKMTNDQWVRREERETAFYAPYASRPIVMYNDPYHPIMTYWLLSQSIENQALWMHHHQDSLSDSARVDAIYKENAQLKAKVDALSNTPRDPTWNPSGVDADLLYNQNYVNASFNPKPKEETVYEYDGGSSGAGKVLLQIMATLLVIAVFGFLMYGFYYLFFEKKFNFRG